MHSLSILCLAAALSAGLATASVPYCPQWFHQLGQAWIAAHPDSPGLQLFVSSPPCSLHCKTSFLAAGPPAANYSAEPPLEADSPYRIASVTKPFTALAVLDLVGRGLLDVHAPVQTYLPDWAVATLRDTQGVLNASQITPWMLLHHTSGLGDHSVGTGYGDRFLANPRLRLTQRDVLEWAVGKIAPVGAPGEAFHYSDTGYVYLGLVVEHLTGLTLPAAVRKAARLDELHMGATWWEIYEPAPEGALPRAGQWDHATDWTQVDASFDLYGGGGLVSNAQDMSTWATAVHRGLLLDGPAMQMLYDTVPVEGMPHLGTGYGCGWIRATYAGQLVWHHTGFWGSFMFYVPSMDLAITGTVNQVAYARSTGQIAEDVIRSILEKERCLRPHMDEL